MLALWKLVDAGKEAALSSSKPFFDETLLPGKPNNHFLCLERPRVSEILAVWVSRR